MPLDPSIPLAVKPVDIKAVDWNDTFKTLATIKYLQANTDAATQKAARDQQLFDETGAAGGYLATLGKSSAPTLQAPVAPPQPGVTGGPPFSDEDLRGLKQGESTPPPGTPVPAVPGQGAPGQPQATQPRPSLLDGDVRSKIYSIAPHVAHSFIKSGLEIEGLSTKQQTDQLELGAKFLEHAGRTLALVNDQPSYDAWKLAMTAHIPPQMLAQLPATYSPDLVTRLQQSTQGVADQMKYRLDQQKVANETKNAETNRILAETGQQAEARQQREVIPITGPEGVRLVDRFPQPGSSPAGPLPGTAPAMAPGAAAAAGSEKQALAAHDILKTAEASNANLAGVLQHGVSAIPGIGGYLTPAANLRYQQAQKQFMTAIGGGDPSQYFVQPGDLGSLKGSRAAYNQLLAQKQAAREAAIQKLRIQTNRPQGLTPPGQTSVTPGSPAPHTPQVYTRAQVSALAAKHKMSEASIEALIRADGDRVAP